MKIGDIEYSSLEGKVSDAEWQARVDLAALYRLIPLMDWWDLSQAPASARVPDEPDAYLFAPLGLLFEEITASSLVKISLAGDVIGEGPFRVSKPIWCPMQAVHAARDDANFVLHLHDDVIAALSARNDKLLPISQPAAFALADGVHYHPYDGVETYPERAPGVQASLGTASTLILHNHGLIALGGSAYEVLLRTTNVRKACHIQLMAGFSKDLRYLDPVLMPGFEQELKQGAAVDHLWPAMLRKLDRIDPSYRF